MAARKKIKVIYSSLGRQKVWGYAHIGELTIELEKSMKGKKMMEVFLHECLHLVNPQMEEEDVEKWGAIIARTMWAEGYRKIDSDVSVKLQDDDK